MKRLLIAMSMALSVAGTDLGKLLKSLEYNYEGINAADDDLVVMMQPAVYLEPENVTNSSWSWSTIKGDDAPMLYMNSNASCLAGPNATAGDAPPLGIRSAPPLGGLAAGTLELRGDGMLTAWTVENNNPAGSAKKPAQPDALFAAKVGTWAKVLQTKPRDASVEGVSSMKFAGLPPTTRLTVTDDSVPAGVGIDLYGYSRMAAGNLERSHLPGIAFSMVFTNDNDYPVNVSSFFNLPAADYNVKRPGTVIQTVENTTKIDCIKLCNNVNCASWELFDDACTLQSDAPFYSFKDGVESAVRSEWVGEGACLTLNRPGTAAMSGNYSLCGTQDPGVSQTYATGAALHDLWKDFAQGEYSQVVNPDDAHGSISLSTTVAGKSTAVLTTVLGYFFPNHNYLDSYYGNNYNNQFKSSKEAAETLLGDLVSTLTDIKAIHMPFGHATMPSWMKENLVGSLHHVRSAIWYADGRWRQWEAYDCVNMDSVHNDGERHIPYLMLFPEATISKLRAWGKYQLPNGMINEELACGCHLKIDPEFEHGCGRVMGDVSSMYIIYLLELLRWGNFQDLVKELYPIAVKAAKWQISIATYHGMPHKIQNTYDVLLMNDYDAATFTAVFQIVSMRAMAELAEFMGDPFDQYETAAAAAVEGLETQMWDESLGAYIAFTSQTAVMADSFYAQVLGYTLGLGTVVNETRLHMHLQTEAKNNYDAFGLQIMTGRNPPGRTEQDIWMMAPADHATLRLRSGFGTVEDALEVGSRPYKRLTEGLKDTWNAPGIMRGNYSGFPGASYITSHYGYYMTLWHTPLALSGQTADLSNGTLSFSPTVAAPFTLPVLLIKVIGTISVASAGGAATLCLTTGEIKGITTLRMGSRVVTTPARDITPASCVSW